MTVERAAEPASVDSDAAAALLTADVDRTAGRVRLSGDLCLATAEQLTAVLAELQAAGVTDIAVELAELRFCDGRGLAVFASASRRLAAAGGSLTLVDPSPLTSRILALTGVAEDVRVVSAQSTGLL